MNNFVTIRCENNGHTYELDMIAVRELQAATNGRDADAVFDRFAPYVPNMDRGGVWHGVDAVK